MAIFAHWPTFARAELSAVFSDYRDRAIKYLDSGDDGIRISHSIPFVVLFLSPLRLFPTAEHASRWLGLSHGFPYQYSHEQNVYTSGRKRREVPSRRKCDISRTKWDFFP
jgi:hypothetical protein